jgi:hypothetical protein
MNEPFGKQRADRTIDQAAGENFFFGGTPLALDKAAGYFPRGVSVFALVHREREKPGSRFGLIGHTGRNENNCVSATNDNGAVRLFGHLTRFQGNLAASQVNFNCVKHIFKTSNLGRETCPNGTPGQSRLGVRYRSLLETGVDRMSNPHRTETTRLGANRACVA